MTDRNEVLKTYVSDMLGVERHILQVIDYQTGDERVQFYSPAYELLLKIQSVLKEHIMILDGILERIEISGAEAFIKKVSSSVMGALSGMYDRVRMDNPVSRNLRDDYTALHMAAISYTMLHTTGLALKDSQVADTAFRHLSDLTPLIVELGKIIPYVVANELVKEDKAIDATAGEVASHNVERAWNCETIIH